MIKIFFCLFLISFSSFAQVVDHDSIGIFYTEQKVTVLIGGPNAHRRLDSFFEAAKVGDNLYLATSDKSFEAKCARNEARATCTMTFLPSSFVTIGQKKMSVSLRVDDTRLSFPETYDVKFQSANGDIFLITIKDGWLKLDGKKK